MSQFFMAFPPTFDSFIVPYGAVGDKRKYKEKEKAQKKLETGAEPFQMRLYTNGLRPSTPKTIDTLPSLFEQLCRQSHTCEDW
ncbi:MAG: hypothetical protein KHZ93_10225 [Clostridiales bacterium]|nr:hypothetical protein [Clostridiales bacterium]